MKLFILLLILVSHQLFAQNHSPEQEPGINFTLTRRLIAELNYAHYQDSIKVSTTVPDENDFNNFSKAKMLIDMNDTGIRDIGMADSLFSAYLDGRCVIRIISQKDFIYNNREASRKDMEWFLKKGTRRVTGIVYKYKDSDQVLICTYEKKK